MADLAAALTRTADRLGLETRLTIETSGGRFRIEIHIHTAYGWTRRDYLDAADVDVRDVIDLLERIQG